MARKKKKLTKLQASRLRTKCMENMKRLFDDKFQYGSESVVKMSSDKFLQIVTKDLANMIKK